MQNSFTKTSQYSAVFTYDPHQRLTRGLVHGPSRDQIPILINQIKDCRDLIGLPMLLPSLLIARRVDSAISKASECHQQILDIEKATGLRTEWYNSRSANNASNQAQSNDWSRYNAIDFDGVTRDLTNLSANLAVCSYVCETFLPILDIFDRINNTCLTNAPQQHQKHFQICRARLRANTAFMRSSLQGSLCRTKYLYQRAQAQVQTVCQKPPSVILTFAYCYCPQLYSLISQKDNALSMQDNAILKTLSEDSKRISLATTRDSSAMCIIAVITILFLPATFTAVSFGSALPVRMAHFSPQGICAANSRLIRRKSDDMT
jgi:hypothetical protein